MSVEQHGAVVVALIMPAAIPATAFRIGTAGWPLPAAERVHFPPGASLLERYSRLFNAVEINSSFYRSHRPDTYRRWAETVPDDFVFSAKLPREITHRRKLLDSEALVDAFASETAGLGSKLAAVLVQLPPSLAPDPGTVERFFTMLRGRMTAALVCEPRHPSWFTGEADGLLARLGVARAAADPAPSPGAELPGAARHTAYVRLHGSPRMYYSDYTPDRLHSYAQDLIAYAGAANEVWCIFDNTADFHATANARDLMRMLDNDAVKSRQEPRSPS